MAVDDEDEEWDAAMKRAAEANESDTAQFGLLDLADAMPGAGPLHTSTQHVSCVAPPCWTADLP